MRSFKGHAGDADTDGGREVGQAERQRNQEHRNQRASRW
jgi:hypothetical protein